MINLQYEISSDREAMDINAIHKFLYTAYWSKGIPKETLKKSIENSLCFGVFFKGNQVGFARVVTDKATFAYIGDVYVIENHRGRGLSTLLLRRVFDHPDLQGLRRIMLATLDAHSLYKQFGFSELSSPEIIMENWNPDAYTKA